MQNLSPRVSSDGAAAAAIDVDQHDLADRLRFD